ncbi:hypothetical protein H4R34_005289 [Dimargaris verticillata]|uniref:Enoyl reductase (ER) domain-containing protein n=1 Tax=Dimargaris verticillata TaxID=2761393 RepID=A0A9W8B372_9FUNG|nr:hypothetical protein H4R34_005289 [Dimargaris verticillata]
MTVTAPKHETVHAYAVKAKGDPIAAWEYKPRPLGNNDVEIEIDHCGICGTDVHMVDNGWGMTRYPITPGHEIIGRVTSKGNAVSKLNLGDVVGVGYQAYACLKPDCPACGRGLDVSCPKGIPTSNGQYPDGHSAQGGFADSIRVDSNYAFAIPKAIDPAIAGPLMCAGATVFTPMLHNRFKSGDRVGVIGIGGLGHLAIQFAKAFGTTVTAFTTSANKVDESKKLGATNAVVMSDENQVKKAANSVDYLIITSNSKNTDWDQLASFVDYKGKLILVALPEEPLSIQAFSLLTKCMSLETSRIGGIEEIPQMLEFAAKHHIRPWVERMPMKDCGKALDKVENGRPRYRVVVSN